jgi:poly(A) polymerase
MHTHEPFDASLGEQERDRAPGAQAPATDGLRVEASRAIAPQRIDQDALRVVSRLQRQGHEAYLVGGCVRDLLLGRKPKDFDVATAAHPRQIRGLFRNARIIGRRFRLAHVVYGEHIIETATFRTKPPQEEENEDLLIREDNAFGTAAEDARRRDFTINGLFLDPLGGRILDYVGGLADLDAGVLRTIGPPDTRMAEDPVRILRAVKFATRLGLRIDEPTWEAMCVSAPMLARSAPPRVFEEILRLLHSGVALGAFRMLRACGALHVLLPRIDGLLGPRSGGDAHAHERADSFWRLLEALDAEVHAERLPSRALCLAVLYLRVVEQRMDAVIGKQDVDPVQLFDAAGEVLDAVALGARLPKRDAAIARRMIAEQVRLHAGPQRSARSLLFVRSEHFPDALDLFRVRLAAWGQGWDLVEAWIASAREASRMPAEEFAKLKSGSGEGRRPRRRRGGRRRRGRGAAGEPQTEGGASDESAEAEGTED